MLRVILALCLILGLLTFRPPESDAQAVQIQAVQILAAHPPVSLRGLCAPAPGVLWTSGSAGTVGRSADGGLHWTWMTVPGFEKRDFRDIEAFDSHTAMIMGIDTPAVILRTTDGGAHWKVVFRDETPGMFLDAMNFTDDQSGIVVGDPIGPARKERFYLACTIDSGKTWTPVSLADRPLADSGEGCFASSGSNMAQAHRADLVFYPFVSGGPASRIFRFGEGKKLPLAQGGASTGANSIGIDRDRWIVVGGDFAHDTETAGNAAYTLDGGDHWRIPHTPPHGYRSCVKHIRGLIWICCGTSGIDITRDGGDRWTLLSRESFHVAAYPGRGGYVYLAGAGGRIAELNLESL